MKKILGVLLLMTAFGLSACNQYESNLTLQDFANAYIAAGYDVDMEEKPLFSLMDATDAVIFYMDLEVVKIYEFRSSASLRESGYEFVAVNDRFGLQSNGDSAIDIFNSVGTTE